MMNTKRVNLLAKEMVKEIIRVMAQNHNKGNQKKKLENQMYLFHSMMRNLKKSKTNQLKRTELRLHLETRMRRIRKSMKKAMVVRNIQMNLI